MTMTTRYLPWALLLLASCGPNTSIPSTNGSTIANSVGGVTSTGGVTSGIPSLGTISTGGGNANSQTPSTGVGTVSVTGSMNGNAWTAQDAVFGVGQTSGGLIYLQVVIADQPNLCTLLGSSSGSANVVIAYLASTNPNVYPVTNTYPVVDPNGSLPDAVTNDSAFSQVAFAPAGVTQGTFANAGQMQITTTAGSVTEPESMAIQVTGVGSDSATGTYTPAYCNLLTPGSSDLVKRLGVSIGLH